MNTPQTPQDQPRRRGRPIKSTEPATERLHVRLTPTQRSAWERLGGSSWLHRQLDEAARLISCGTKKDQEPA